MLRTENISFSVGKKQILKNVSASFLPGEFNMILGPNGSGKSSFLKIFSGEINRFQGTVLYEDKKIKELRKEELAKKRAVMSQQADLGFPLLVEEVVMMGRYPHFTFNPNKKDITICNEVIERMNLVEFKERNYLTLSGGEKQRLSIARSLLRHPHLLIFDEATSSLDSITEEEITGTIKAISKEKEQITVLIAHRLSTIMHADRIYVLEKGQVVETGTHHELLEEKGLYYAMWRQQIGERKYATAPVA